MSSLLDCSLRHRFVIPTNADVGASRVKGRSSFCFRQKIKQAPSPAGEDPCTYLCGNSLGLLPQPAEALVRQEIRIWGSRQAPSTSMSQFHFISPTAIFHVRRAVQGHHDHPYGREWVNITDHVNPLLAELLGGENFAVCPGALVLGLTFSLSMAKRCTRD
jgi:kynureninase